MRSRRKSTVRLAADTQYAFALTGPRVRDFKRLATRLDGLVQSSNVQGLGKRQSSLGISSKTERPLSEREIAFSCAMTAAKLASGSSRVSTAPAKRSRRR